MIRIKIYESVKDIIKNNKSLKLALCIVSAFMITALFAPYIANDKPLIIKYKSEWLFPAFSNKHQFITKNGDTLNYDMRNDWKFVEAEFSIFPPCAYSSNTLDVTNAPLKSPFGNQYLTLKNGTIISIPLKYRHWLGTTQNGNDILSGIIHGARISLSVGLFSTLIAVFLGIIVGVYSGYYGNYSIKKGPIQLLFLIISLPFMWFYGFYVRSNTLSEAFNIGGLELVYQLFLSLILSGCTMYAFSFLGKKLDTVLRNSKKIYLPLDTIISKGIEVLNSIPDLLLIIVLASFAKPSYTSLIILIGFLCFVSIARIVRAEYMKAKELNYVISCKAIGMKDYRIILKHILPNILPLILVQAVFTIINAIVLESALSFLGISVPNNIVTWGTLLNEAKEHFSSWWLVVFPGLCLFILLYALNSIATEINKK